MGLSNEGYFLGDFLKISLGPPFARFQKMLVLGDVAKIAITWAFGYSWSRLWRQNLLRSLHYKCILIRLLCHLRQSAVGPLKPGLLFGQLLKNFSSSRFCTFSENGGFE